MDMNELISQYPAIAAKAAEMGKIKQSMFNKKQYASTIDAWNALSQEEKAKLNSEMETAEVVMKKAVITPTAVCFINEGCFHVVPVKDIIWAYAHITKESVNFIPTNKVHQVRMMDRNGNHYNLASLNTLAFSKKSPATDFLETMSNILRPVRPGIIYGYSKEIEQFCLGNLPAAVAKVDADSQIG
ncbi:MAG: hypothetical protein IKG93_08755 [Clostridiales bacterium]|nr:hypothetical protein [Clostridiales bacterium]